MTEITQLNPEQWVDRYGDSLFRFAFSRVNNRDIAEDLVQETFLAAVRDKGGYRGRSSEKTWLIGILKHKLIDHYRKQKPFLYAQEDMDDPDRMSAFFHAKGGWKVLPAHWRSDPGKAQEAKDFLDHFYLCLAGLPNRTADAFVYREVDGMDTETICRELGISRSNCWVLLYRARMLLRKCLEDVGFGQARR